MSAELIPLLAQGMNNPSSTLQEVLLSQLDTSDPTVSVLMQMLANQSSNNNTEDKDAEKQEEDEIAQRRLRKLSAATQQLRHKYEALQLEVQELQLRNDTLAAALGACYLCWGELPDCELCRGSGTVGYFPIDTLAFSEFVLPALRYLKKDKKQQAFNGKESFIQN
jgi:hypothetical protein